VGTPEGMESLLHLDLVSNYFDVVDNVDEADNALVGLTSPDGGVGYDRAHLEKGGNAMFPFYWN